MRRHFKSKHPFIYAKETNQHLHSDVEYEKEDEKCDIIESDVEEETHEKDETLTATGKKVIHNRGWVRKYSKKIGVTEHECGVCKKVLKLPPGFMSNMRRHFKSQHPSIFAKETNQHLDSDIENEKEEKKCDSKDSDVEEETQEKEDDDKVEEEEYIIEYLLEENPAKISINTNESKKISKKIPVPFNRGWVRKYMTQIDNEHSYECVVCKAVLKLPNGNLNNMRRHFASKHSYIYTREQDLCYDSRSENEDKHEEADNVEEHGDDVYVIEEMILENQTESTEKESEAFFQDD
ncbi:Uncharacterized protein OBRU01_26674 [Operophtera brumata]|uniref:BED-type domain-containing protein n=1 Tax=Operophtera brumata TaxID=104452 RepID=A0A0L7K2V6_OPEBR|nr:Uncharacterized protein OBRU01_26674 [Operophtera brumata]